jgi:branched-subunit amino acid aminotransferase/4-amino-4-deoxychorismate lyase
MPERIVYLNGNFVPESQAHVSIVDRAVVLGATVTEMTRTFHRKPFKLATHIARLYRSLRYTRIDVGLTPEELTDISLRVLEMNFPLTDTEELGLVHFATPGIMAYYADVDPSAVKPTLCAHVFPLRFQPYKRFFLEGVHVVTPSIRHVPPQCYDPKMKYRSRMHFYLADQEIAQSHPGAIALLLDLDGNVTETGGANFLIAQDGAIHAPTLRNTLNGVSRQTIAEICAQLGIPFIERDILTFDVMNADEAYLATTPICLAPVVKINNAPIGSGKPGPLLKRILQAWNEMVGLDIVAQVTGNERKTADL